MNYLELFPQQLAGLQLNNDLTIFDTRDSASFNQGHIPGARMINDNEIKKLIIQKKRNSPVIVYCAHGNSSRDICHLLCGMGFKEVYNLEGGWLGWQNLQDKNPEFESPPHSNLDLC
jgi:rhodanese-related sulfurtransferase